MFISHQSLFIWHTRPTWLWHIFNDIHEPKEGHTCVETCMGLFWVLFSWLFFFWCARGIKNDTKLNSTHVLLSLVSFFIPHQRKCHNHLGWCHIRTLVGDQNGILFLGGKTFMLFFIHPYCSQVVCVCVCVCVEYNTLLHPSLYVYTCTHTYTHSKSFYKCLSTNLYRSTRIMNTPCMHNLFFGKKKHF